MMLRKIGSLLRGKATPYQVLMACLLGGAIGFMPSFAAAAGLIVVLTLALVMLNANLFLAVLVMAAAKLLSLAALPVSFLVGRALLDGPTQPLFKAMVNAPVLALFGFEYYATTGGLALGLLFGLVCGVLVVKALGRFRQRMGQLEEGSERYRKWSTKKWVKALAWLLFGGGHGKKTYAELSSRRVGNPVRPLGVVLAAMAVVLLVIARFFLTEPIVTAALRGGLERANGATVDLASAELDLSGGKLSLTGLAMADPNDLGRNIISAGRVEADVSNADLLRKRLVIDRIELIDAIQGGERAVPGRLVGSPPSPAPAPKEQKTLEDYFEDAKKLKARLAQIRRWLEKVSPQSEGEEEADPDDPEAPERGPTLEERLRQRARELGYGRVRAEHLIAGSPMLTVRKLVANGVPVEALEGETVDIDGENLSTQPALLDQPPRLRVVSSKRTLEFDLQPTSDPSTAEPGKLKLALRDLAAAKIGRALSLGGKEPLKGGRITLTADGQWRAGWIDLPLTLAGRDLDVEVGGSAKTINSLEFAVGLVGPMDNPGVKLDEKALQRALVKSLGANLLKRALGDDASRITDNIPGLGGDNNDEDGDGDGDEAGEGGDNPIDQGRKLFDGLRGGNDQ